MARAITKKQKEFADEYLQTGNATQSALKVYDTDSLDVAKSIGSENLTKPNVEKYLQEKSLKAAEVINEIMIHGENDNVRLNAAKDVLDRAGFKATEKHLNINVTKKIISVDE